MKETANTSPCAECRYYASGKCDHPRRNPSLWAYIDPIMQDTPRVAAMLTRCSREIMRQGYGTAYALPALADYDNRCPIVC